MASMEEIELERHRGRLDRDVADLVEKYMAIMGWNIPEIDVARARAFIVGELKAALGRIESGAR
ncbi:MAG: hypothetical protein MUF79_06680 [Burkholderiales bacterium]|jgi:hypothetical protein|nr:hypothetical protein [Burkholderiales bacterium]